MSIEENERGGWDKDCFSILQIKGNEFKVNSAQMADHIPYCTTPNISSKDLRKGQHFLVSWKDTFMWQQVFLSCTSELYKYVMCLYLSGILR